MKPTQFGKQHATLQKSVINPLQKGTAHRQVFGALGMTPSQATGATKMLRTVGWDIPRPRPSSPTGASALPRARSAGGLG
jgi:hypothetical protein